MLDDRRHILPGRINICATVFVVRACVPRLAVRSLGSERLPRWAVGPLRRFRLHARHVRMLQAAFLHRAKRNYSTTRLWRTRTRRRGDDTALHARLRINRIPVDRLRFGPQPGHLGMCLRPYRPSGHHLLHRRRQFCHQRLFTRPDLRHAPRLPLGHSSTERQRPRHPPRRSRKPHDDLLRGAGAMLDDRWHVLPARVGTRTSASVVVNACVSRLTVCSLGPERLPCWAVGPL